MLYENRTSKNFKICNIHLHIFRNFIQLDLNDKIDHLIQNYIRTLDGFNEINAITIGVKWDIQICCVVWVYWKFCFLEKIRVTVFRQLNYVPGVIVQSADERKIFQGFSHLLIVGENFFFYCEYDVHLQHLSFKNYLIEE